MEEKTLTGYPSIDKPWLKYYSAEAINAPLPEGTIYQYLWQNNHEHLHDTALIYFGRKISYGKLFESIEKTAKAFSALGVKRGDIVTVCAVTIPEVIYALYALNRLGAVSNMIDPRTSADGIRKYIDEVDCKFILCIDVVYPKIREAVKGAAIAQIIVLSPADSLPQPKKLLYSLKVKSIDLGEKALRWPTLLKLADGVNIAYAPCEKGVCCVIEHTGGTTGFPKGVMLSNDNMNALSHQFAFGMDTRRKQRFLNIMPPFIAYGVAIGIHMPLCCGNTVILIPQFDPAKFDRLLIKYRPNHFCGVPTHFDSLYVSKKMVNFDLSFLVSPGVGGDRFALDTEEKINNFLLGHGCKYKAAKGYGMTETSSSACSCAFLGLNNDKNKPGSVGIPMLHNIFGVFDPNTGKELAYGKNGEICIHAPTTMLGYYKNEAETSKILRLHDDGLLWVHSGDLGYIDEDGCVFIQGRIKRMIIRHDGFKVFPTFVEDAVCKHNAVSACCAVGVPDKSYSQGQLPAVYIVLRPGCAKSETEVMTELRTICENELPEYARPAAHFFRDSLPLTPIGKVDYRALEKLAAEAEGQAQTFKP